MRQRLIRYAGALLVSLVSTYSGLSRFAMAERPQTPVCTLLDVQAWQAALDEPAEEATPDYILRTTEAFISKCPARPEIAAAHRLAGLSAGWAKNPEVAVQHFDRAGPMRDTDALFMAGAASLAMGEAEKALGYRDRAIDIWLKRLERQGGAEITTAELDTGEIISVTFDRTRPESDASHLWLARPRAGGWPATLSITSSEQINAFYRMRAGAAAARLSSVQLYRCDTRRLLGRSDRALATEDMNAMAILALTAYLAAPDTPEPGDFKICHFTDEILPEMALSQRVPTR